MIVQVVRMHVRQRDKSRDEKGNSRELRRAGNGGSWNSFKVYVCTQVEAPLRQMERLYKSRRINRRGDNVSFHDSYVASGKIGESLAAKHRLILIRDRALRASQFPIAV